MTVGAAVEVFVTAFCQLKSRTHPYVPEKVDGLWIMRDGPGRKVPRKIEIASVDLPPEETARRIKKQGIGWHFLCEIHPLEADYEGIRLKYKSLGYRAVSTEWLFIHHLKNIPEYESLPPVRQLLTPEAVNAVPQRARHKRKLLDGTRKYAIWDEETDYGWVTSVPVGKAAWAAALYVHADARGRGFGRALMSRLLLDDKASGTETSVLLASSDGARLYPYLGYEKIAILQMFCPASREPG